MAETLNALKDLLSTIFEFAVHEEPQATNSRGWEMASTIIAGVLVFVVCEWLKEVWLSPLQEYKKLKAKVSKLLIVHAQYYSNPITIKQQMQEESTKATIEQQMQNEYSKASSEIRELASEVSAFAEIIPYIHWGIPDVKNIAEAGRCLIGLSNGFYIGNEESALTHSKQNAETRNKIKELLKLRGMPK